MERSRFGSSFGRLRRGIRGDEGWALRLQLSVPLPVGVQRVSPAFEPPLPLSPVSQLTVPRALCTQLKDWPVELVQLLTAPRLATQVRSPPFQPWQLVVPSELLMQYVSKVPALTACPSTNDPITQLSRTAGSSWRIIRNVVRQTANNHWGLELLPRQMQQMCCLPGTQKWVYSLWSCVSLGFASGRLP